MALAINEYGLIGDTRTAALISKEGSIDWCCFPGFDSGSFFARILDKDAGHMQICPQGQFSSEQRYLPGTNVLETIFTTTDGVVKILDCFTVDTEENKTKMLRPLHEILRVVEGIEGKVSMVYTFKPMPFFANGKAKIGQRGKLGINCEYGNELVVLKHDLLETTEDFTVSKGERRIFSLSHNIIAPAVIPSLGESALKRLESTITYWHNWISQCNYQGEFKEEVLRSVLALKLLTYSPSGAIIAAPTTSLPEMIGGNRNWDYRYCWLRDAAFTIRSFLALGFIHEARAYMSWILHSTALTHPHLQVLYSVFGHAKIPERKLHWLAGYEGSSPVRIGNGADVQFQLDVYGEVMYAIYLFAPYIKKFDTDNVLFLKNIADSVCELWDRPDEGIWEIRSKGLHHVHSKVMSYVALEKFIELSQRMNWSYPLDKYLKSAKEIKNQVELHGYNEELKAYTRTYDDNELDAAILTLPIFTENWDKGHMESTVFSIKQHLMKKGVVYRYLHQDDGIKGPEGGFLACSFWLVEALAKLGKKAIAKDVMNNLLKRKNTIGLWSEEIDPNTNQFLGNYPQAFSHTALISAALSLQEVP
ncbi:MAG: glycoside hydrolase family 15 protein [Bacteriovoracaceae bacterium]|nr:glycoside hydrolase family 15 protein [Bacteriovoracaceae bacterium]